MKITEQDLKDTSVEIISEILAVMERKGDHTFHSGHETLGIITEEYHEFVEAIHSNNKNKIQEELIDLAISAIAGLISFRKATGIQ